MTTRERAMLELGRVAAACGLDHDWWNEALAKYNRAMIPDEVRAQRSAAASKVAKARVRTMDVNARVTDAIRALDGEPASVAALAARAGLSENPVFRMRAEGLIQVDDRKCWTIADRRRGEDAA